MDKVDIVLRERVAARLAREYQEMLDRMRQNPPGAGNCLTSVLDDHFAAEHKVGSFGRMMLETDPPVVKVAPIEIDRELRYRNDVKTNLEWGLAFTHDRRTVESGVQLNREPVWPVPIKPDNFPRKQAEKSLFFHMMRTYTEPILLVNPDQSTINTLSRCGGGYATVTNTHDIEIIDDFKACLKNLATPNVYWCLPTALAGKKCYLGSGGVKEFIGEWFRLIPSPFTYSANRTVDVTGEPGSRKWVMTELRGRNVQRLVKVLWGEDEPSIVYNSNTVRATLHCGDGWLLQSTFPIPVTEVEDERIVSCPVYIDNRPTKRVLENIDGEKRVLTVYQDDPQTVIDVDGPGVFFSRKSRTTLPEEYSWARYRASPTGLTITSVNNHPVYDSSVKCHYLRPQDSEFIGLGGAFAFVNPTLEVLHLKEETKVQSFPPLYLPAGEHTLWKGQTIMPRWRGDSLQTIYLPQDTEAGAMIFQHTRGVMRGTQGEVKRSLKVRHSGITFVFINGYESGQNWTYMPGELDLYHVIQIKRFFFSGLPALSEVSAGFRGKRAVPIQEIALKYEVSSWKDSGFTVSNVYHALPNYESPAAINQNIASNRDILMWHDGTYVDIRNVRIPFEGELKKGFADGAFISDVLWETAVSSQYQFTLTNFPPGQFLDLCKANGIIFDFIVHDSGYRCRLRWPRYYKPIQKYTPASTSEFFT